MGLTENDDDDNNDDDNNDEYNTEDDTPKILPRKRRLPLSFWVVGFPDWVRNRPRTNPLLDKDDNDER